MSFVCASSAAPQTLQCVSKKETIEDLEEKTPVLMNPIQSFAFNDWFCCLTFQKPSLSSPLTGSSTSISNSRGSPVKLLRRRFCHLSIDGVLAIESIAVELPSVAVDADASDTLQPGYGLSWKLRCNRPLMVANVSLNWRDQLNVILDGCFSDVNKLVAIVPELTNRSSSSFAYGIIESVSFCALSRSPCLR